MVYFVNLYYIETQRLKSSEIYYLAKSIRIKDRVFTIRENIGKIRPTPEEEANLISKPNLALEIKVINKKINMSKAIYKTKHIQLDNVHRLEKTRYWEYMFSLFLASSEKEYFEVGSEIEYVHGTTAIEGNTFSLQQVDDLLQMRVPPSDKSLREINEVQNYFKVKNFRESYRRMVTIPFIRKLHELIMDKIDTQSAGKFRRIDSIGIRGIDITVSPTILIESELQIIIDEYYANIKTGGHPFEEALLFHYKFEIIHPFTDGNGRVGREIINHMLTKEGFPRLIIRKTDREKYINALQCGNQGFFENMLSDFIDILEDARATLFEEILSGKLSMNS